MANSAHGFEARDLDSLKNSTKQGLQDVVSALLCGTSDDVRLKAAEEIRKLTKTSAQRRVQLAAAGVIPPLVSMLESRNTEIKEAAMLALLNLAVQNERNKIKIVSVGGMASLVNVLQSESLNLKESAAVVVLTLSVANANKPIIGSSGVIPCLVEMLLSGSLQGKVDAVLALYNLSTHADNAARILSACAVPPLVTMLKDCKKVSKVAEKITAILESVAFFKEGRSAIVNEKGGLLAVVEVLEEGSPNGKEHALGVLLTMCQSNRLKYRQAILEEGVIPGLLELTVQGSPETQEKAHVLLKLLRDSPELPRLASTSGMLESVVCNIASHNSHLDNEESGTDSAKKMLTEMVQLSMECSMRHLQQRAVTRKPTRPSR